LRRLVPFLFLGPHQALEQVRLRDTLQRLAGEVGARLLQLAIERLNGAGQQRQLALIELAAALAADLR
jgi:hypothetical protein